MTSHPREITTTTLDWRGTLIELSYEPEAFGGLTAHLTLKALEPPRAPLPISETGFRSHFIGRERIDEAGGPLAYAEAWLNHAASKKSWIAGEDERRQLSLF